MKQRSIRLVMLALLAGCGGGGGSSEASKTVSPIIGNWRMTKLSGEQSGIGLTLNCPGNINIPTVGSASCSDKEKISFAADGSFVASGALTVSTPSVSIPTLPTNATGSWVYSGTMLTLTPGTTTTAAAISAQVGFSDANTMVITIKQTTSGTEVTGIATLIRQ
jgi:hypothetical protein